MISLLVNGIHKAMEQERRDGQIDYTVCMTFYRRLKQKLGLKYAVYSMDKHPDDIIALGAFRFYHRPTRKPTTFRWWDEWWLLQITP